MQMRIDPITKIWSARVTQDESQHREREHTVTLSSFILSEQLQYQSQKLKDSNQQTSEGD